MKPLSHLLLVAIAGISFISGCATTVPREMKLADPNNRRTVDHPGMNVDAIRQACAETMLNASPATEANDIDTRVLSATDPAIIEVDATLKDVGMFNQNLQVTYRCEYREGSLTLGTWTRGLKGGEK